MDSMASSYCDADLYSLASSDTELGPASSPPSDSEAGWVRRGLSHDKRAAGGEVQAELAAATATVAQLRSYNQSLEHQLSTVTSLLQTFSQNHEETMRQLVSSHEETIRKMTQDREETSRKMVQEVATLMQAAKAG